MGWLTNSVDVEHLKAESICPYSKRLFTSHETIAQFNAETARDEPLNGKRSLEIYLTPGEDVTGKEGRPKGSTKAAHTAAEGWVAAVWIKSSHLLYTTW